ncbi:MAG: hypothetical protein ABL994_18620, partial [Verrucomicrobiales bacterium]
EMGWAMADLWELREKTGDVDGALKLSEERNRMLEKLVQENQASKSFQFQLAHGYSTRGDLLGRRQPDSKEERLTLYRRAVAIYIKFETELSAKEQGGLEDLLKRIRQLEEVPAE